MSLWMVVEYFVVNWPNFRLPGFYYSIVSQYVFIHDCMCVFIVHALCISMNMYVYVYTVGGRFRKKPIRMYRYLD